MDTYYKLYSTCIPIKGIDRSAIYDLGRETYRLIPNSLYDILVSYPVISLKELKKEYEGQDETLNEYFDFLLEVEYLFNIDKDELNNFPALDFTWDYPAYITNLVIEIGTFDEDKLTKVFETVDQLGCRFLQLIFIDFSTEALKNTIEIIDRFRFNGVEMILKNEAVESLDFDKVVSILGLSDRRYRIVVEDCPKRKISRLNDCKDSVLWLEKKYDLVKREEKGSFFNVNMDLFLESQHHNNYLNRKLFVGRDGTIKNAKNRIEKFGNFNEIATVNDLLKIIQSEKFQTFWNVTKDQITECAQCEFRYMCVDDRELIETNDGGYTFKEKCVLIKQNVESLEEC